MQMTEKEMIAWIDKSDYETLLRKWRFGKLGDPIFQDEVGDHFEKVLFEKKAALQAGTAPGRVIGDDASDVSKKVGWEHE